MGEIPTIALIEIVLLWITILVTITPTYRVSREGALPLLPYLAWVGFAALLNLSVLALSLP